MIELGCRGRGGRSVTAAAIVPGGAALAEVKAYLWLDGEDEDTELTRLIAVAIGHGEALTGRVFLTRGVTEVLPAAREWARLTLGPVRAITAVVGLDAGGASVALAAGASGIDIDAGGDGWVRVTDAGGLSRVQASYQAGVAADWAGLPEPLRQGAVRLAAHLFTHRDAADESAPPAAVAALWRPWRRMRLL